MEKVKTAVAGRNYRVTPKGTWDVTEEFQIINGFVGLKYQEKVIKETVELNKKSFIAACDTLADGDNQIAFKKTGTALSPEVDVTLYTVERKKYDYSKSINGRVSLEQFTKAFDWKVTKKPIFATAPDGIGQQPVSGFFATVRQNANDTETPLGVVKARYECLQNERIIGVVDDLLGVGGGEVYDYWSHAGGARNAARILFPQYLAPNVDDPKDFLQLCLSLKWSHDGSGSVSYVVSAIRYYCLNGLLRLGKVHAIDTVRHTRTADFKLEGIRKILVDAEGEFTELGETFRRISEVPLTGDRLGAYVKKVLGVDEEKKEISTRTQNVIDTIEVLAQRGRGNTGRSLWDAYNGVTEYVDHHREGKDTGWSAVAGGGAELKSRALDIAEEFAEAIQVR